MAGAGEYEAMVFPKNAAPFRHKVNAPDPFTAKRIIENSTGSRVAGLPSQVSHSSFTTIEPQESSNSCDDDDTSSSGHQTSMGSEGNGLVLLAGLGLMAALTASAWGMATYFSRNPDCMRKIPRKVWIIGGVLLSVFVIRGGIILSNELFNANQNNSVSTSIQPSLNIPGRKANA